ncbi:MAG: enoyl-CoA hydratase/isomerase family protein, partial [Candidatus Thermoplasmatota archaeon]|nr:enoyl-CoA hydratase/isomerase family protein [Candidatus Thermoplasmatota archaeon]
QSLCQNVDEKSSWSIPDFFFKQAENDTPWDFSYVDTQINDGIATITINRPEAMNALNETVVNQLGVAVNVVNANESVHTIVLDGAGKAFVAGADVKFFVDKIRSDSIGDIVEFTSNGHKVLNSIENSPKVTIALTTGLALGGGLELALCCDYRIGTRRTQFRFPETSIGIYPGLGGSQRPARISGIPLARWAVLGGNFMNAQTAYDIGLLTHLVDLADVDKATNNCASNGKPSDKYSGKPANADSNVVKFATDFYRDENLPILISGGCPDGYDAEDKTISRQLKNLKYTAPIALSMASDLINITANTTLEQGLDSELAKLTDIFSTKDALEGLSALIEGRRATYQNS